MKYIFAFDGGGTKTRLNVVDLSGNILYDQITTGCNIFSIGDSAFTSVIRGLYHQAKEALNVNDRDIELVYLGLSGADLKSDYKRLYDACRPIFEDVRHIIVNDAWIILRSGLKESYGAVCICGTGTNSAALSKEGKKAILRSLSYTLGTRGGGLDIARDALHYAFRSEELTFQKTMLEEAIPQLLGVDNMAEVVPLFYPKMTITKQAFGSITGLVSDLAVLGDEVSIMILKDIASHIALQTVGVIKQVGADQEAIPVVIGGRVFTMKANVFIEEFEKVLQSEVPYATVVKPRFTPVIGAYLFALDELDIPQTQEIEQNLLKSGGGI